jgi:hypothetical protein
MAKRLGIVQSGGIGDIIIALPIADHYEAQGYEIVWPVAADTAAAFSAIKPSIKFLPVARGSDLALNEPLRLIQQHECERTIILYSYLKDAAVYDPRLSSALKFDEYKYAIAGVPFAKKWELNYVRNIDRERALYDSLEIDSDYVCFHGLSSKMTEPLRLPGHMAEGLRVIEMTKRSDNESPFDWLRTLERASKLVLVDSCFANLVEQMNLPNKKAVIVENPVAFTPVFKNGWQFLFPEAFKND